MAYSHFVVLIYGTILLSVSFAVPVEDISSPGADHVLAMLQESQSMAAAEAERRSNEEELAMAQQQLDALAVEANRAAAAVASELEATRKDAEASLLQAKQISGRLEAEAKALHERLKPIGLKPKPNPIGLKPRPRICCKAMTSSCLACSKGVSVKVFCKTSPGKYGCPKPKPRPTYPPPPAPPDWWKNPFYPPRTSKPKPRPTQPPSPPPPSHFCCKAMTSRCLACSKGVSVKVFCKTSPGKYGCPKPKPRPRICCKAMTSSCLACSKGVSVKEFCKNSPGKYGCLKKKDLPWHRMG